MKKIANLKSDDFYGIYNFFELSRKNFYKSPFIVFIMGMISIMLIIPYNQVYKNNQDKDLGLKIFFIFMVVFFIILYILATYLFINILLKKKSKILFSLFYLVSGISIPLTLWLVSLSDMSYKSSSYSNIITFILGYIFCIIFFAICVLRERKRLIERYYSKENKNSIINVKKFMLYLSLAIVPVFPFFIRGFRANKTITKVFGKTYTAIGFYYLSVVVFIMMSIFLSKEVFYIYHSLKFKKEGLENED